MKLILIAILLAVPAHGQQSAEPSLGPARAEAGKAFTAEMSIDAKACIKTGTLAALNDCIETALTQSKLNLKMFRSAIANLIKARQALFDSQLLDRFASSEAAWNAYSEEEAQVTADMVDGPDASVSADSTRIELIKSHMQNLDKFYNILLHSNCGACLVDR